MGRGHRHLPMGLAALLGLSLLGCGVEDPTGDPPSATPSPSIPSDPTPSAPGGTPSPTASALPTGTAAPTPTPTRAPTQTPIPPTPTSGEITPTPTSGAITPTPTSGETTPTRGAPTPTFGAATRTPIAPTPTLGASTSTPWATATAAPSPTPAPTPSPTPTAAPTPDLYAEGDPLVRLDSYDPSEDFRDQFNQGDPGSDPDAPPSGDATPPPNGRVAPADTPTPPPPPNCGIPEGQDPGSWTPPAGCPPVECIRPPEADPETWEPPEICTPVECGPPPGTDIFEWQPPLACLPPECQPPEGVDPETWERPEACLFDPCEAPPNAVEGQWFPPTECIPAECFRPDDVAPEDWIAPEGCPPIPDGGEGGGGARQIFFEFTAAAHLGGSVYLGGQGGLFGARSLGEGLSPEPVSVYNDMPRVKFISTSGDRFVASTETQIYVFEEAGGEIGEDNLVLKRGLPQQLYPGRVHLTGDFLVVPGFSDGVLFADPERFDQLGYLEHGFVNAMAADVTGDIAWIADGTGGLKAVDVTDVTAPVIIAELPLPGVAQVITHDDAESTLFVALGSAGVAVVDITEPLAPALITLIDTRGSAFGLDYDAGHLFVAAWSVLEVYDVKDPPHPTLLTLEWPVFSAMDVSAQGAEVALGDWYQATWYQFFEERRSSELYASVESVRFETGAAGENAVEALTLYNDGARPLQVLGIDIASEGAFTVSPEAFTIPPRGRQTVEISHTIGADASALVEGTLRVNCGDPDVNDFSIALSYGGAGVTLGAPAPDFTLESMGGELITLSDQVDSVVMLAYFTTW